MANFKRVIPDVLCVALFAIIAFAYFMPATLDGRRLEQHDSTANDGIKIEMQQYRDAHDNNVPRWISSVFGGMPTYQIAPEYKPDAVIKHVERATHLWFPEYVWYIFASMLGFFILLRVFDFKPWMAALGAVAWAFSSYFFIIIAAGHIWKVMCLAYIPPTIAGMVLCYRGVWRNLSSQSTPSSQSAPSVLSTRKTPENFATLLAGTALTALYAALQIKANHVQMTYYFLTVELAMWLAFLIMAWKGKHMAEFWRGTAGVAVAAAIAVAMNLSNLYHTYEYSKETMRGKSELVKAGKTDDQTDSGLERSYITAWSYGIDETFTFLIPNAKGGASVPLSMNKTAMEKADPQYEQAGIYGAFTQYWGEQPGTSGPVYLGALVCMLFVLAMFVIPNKHPMKWTLLAATIVTLMLGWGHNFMPFTDFFIDHVPMYSKFRTVASILVVVEFTVPFMALWGLKLWCEKPTLKPLLYATIFTVVLCLGYDMFSGDCISTSDRNAMVQYVQAGYFDQGMAASILASLSRMRSAMIASDVVRSIAFIGMGAACMWWFFNVSRKYDGDLKPAQATILCIALLALCVADMWTVNKRYLNDDMFVTPRGVARLQKTDADNYILSKSGTGRDYRVADLTSSIFNSNDACAFYSSIGGYHPAKLRRYQELIEAHITPELNRFYEGLRMAKLDTAAMAGQATPYPIYNYEGVNVDSLYPVLNMLNTRWFILGAGEKGEVKMPVENEAAMGNGWFATNIEWAANANEELDALSTTNLRSTAVVAKADFGFLKPGGTGTVKVKQYGTTEVKYDVESKDGGLVVFSEVYYPGWTATIDGTETEIGRANYILRAINVPAGKHEVVFNFDPQTVHTTETIGYCGLGLLAILILGAVAVPFINKKEEK